MSRGLRRNLLVHLLTLVLLLSLSPPRPEAQVVSNHGKPIASVEALQGGAAVRSAGSDSWRKLEIGHGIHRGDVIRTGSGALLDLKFEGGRIRLFEETLLSIPISGNLEELQLVRLEQGKGIFQLVRGFFRKVSLFLGLERPFEVETPTLVASVRGTNFQIQQTLDIGWVSIYEGCLQVTDDARQVADAVRLCTGEETFVRRGHRPERPMPIQAGQDGYRGVLPSDGERAPRGPNEDRGAAVDATREAIREAIRDVIRTSAAEAAVEAVREIAQEAANQATLEGASQGAQGGGGQGGTTGGGTGGTTGGTTGGGTVLLVPGGGGGTSGTVGGQILTPGSTPDCGVRGSPIRSRGRPTGCRAGPK